MENIVNVFNEQPHLEDQSSLDDSSMDKTPEAIEESIFNASDEELVDETDDDFNLDRGIDS
ncbi:MAG: hypothetical protein V2I33_24285, partial [Kangiellaceae bacterium]|nr:hypothetical protein [Kangiellaceae bacterium]